MKYRVEITDSAWRDLQEAYLWIRDEYSTEVAASWRAGLVDVADTLETFPQRCAHAPEARFFGREIRQLLYGRGARGTYRILFEVVGETVYVLHIRHSARTPLSPEPASGLEEPD